MLTGVSVMLSLTDCRLACWVNAVNHASTPHLVTCLHVTWRRDHAHSVTVRSHESVCVPAGWDEEELATWTGGWYLEVTLCPYWRHRRTSTRSKQQSTVAMTTTTQIVHCDNADSLRTTPYIDAAAVAWRLELCDVSRPTLCGQHHRATARLFASNNRLQLLKHATCLKPGFQPTQRTQRNERS